MVVLRYNGVDNSACSFGFHVVLLAGMSSCVWRSNGVGVNCTQRNERSIRDRSLNGIDTTSKTIIKIGTTRTTI